MTEIVQLDSSNRLVLPRDLRRVAGVTPRQKFRVSAVPGRIVFEADENPRGKVVKRGKLKVWNGEVPKTPIAEAVEESRHYSR